MIEICTAIVVIAACGDTSSLVDTTQAMTDTRASVVSFSAEIVGERGASGASYGRDSHEIIFMIWPPERPRMLLSRKQAGGWRRPVDALDGFPGLAIGPALAPDGQTLYFESTARSPAIAGRTDTDLWVARRNGLTWADARPLGRPFNSEWQEHSPTVSASGTLCFNSSRPGGNGGHDIYCARQNGDGWVEPINAGSGINSSDTEGAPHIAPDERYMVFGSDRPGGFGGDDLYISYRRDGVWQPAINLGPAVNSANGEWAPSVSPDGRTLLFTRSVGEGSSAKFTLVEIPMGDIQTPLRAPADSIAPPRRAHHSVVWDAANQRVLMTGGSTPVDGGNSFVFFNDVWALDGSTWKKLGESGPRMSGSTLAYDAKARRVLSFGGYESGRSIGALRQLENSEWRDLTARVESPVSEPGFVYDVGRNSFVAFGGSAGRGQANGDTWTFDGTRWEKLSIPGPPARQAHVMVYDEKRGRSVVFGGMGSGRPGQPPPVFGDTWEFDGAKWSQLQVAGPTARNSAEAVYDSRRGVVILFGGSDSSGFKGDTWSWNGSEWRLLSESGPDPRVMGKLAYDAKRDRVILFGGRKGWPDGDLNDTWEWDGSKWRKISG